MFGGGVVAAGDPKFNDDSVCVPLLLLKLIFGLLLGIDTNEGARDPRGDGN